MKIANREDLISHCAVFLKLTQCYVNNNSTGLWGGKGVWALGSHCFHVDLALHFICLSYCILTTTPWACIISPFNRGGNWGVGMSSNQSKLYSWPGEMEGFGPDLTEWKGQALKKDRQCSDSFTFVAIVYFDVSFLLKAEGCLLEQFILCTAENYKGFPQGNLICCWILNVFTWFPKDAFFKK